MTSASTSASIGTYCMNLAMFRPAAARVRTAACSAGSAYVRGTASNSTMPPVTIAAQPFPDVALVQARGRGDGVARGRRQGRHRFEQAGLAADARHQGQQRAVEDAHHPPAKASLLACPLRPRHRELPFR